MGLRDQIRQQAGDVEIRKIDITEWPGVDVYVRTLSGRTREMLEQRLTKNENENDIRAFICACGLCDADGVTPYDFAKPEDVDELNQKGAVVLNMIAEAVMSVNKMGDDDIEELEKN